ncbi:MAG: hypothetical protein IT178_12875 [Acidobacteria bacterium]|nr:hypothetical protein [Acidobacteriota bacterium]
MLLDTPDAVFDSARDAVKRRDWPAFFICVDRKDLLRIASNGLTHLLGQAATAPDVLTKFCASHGIPVESLEPAQQAARRVVESAAAYARVHHPGAGATGAAPPADVNGPHTHLQLVADYKRQLQHVLTAAPDLPGLTAALEQHLRATAGGGSVSSSLFVGETLHDVDIDGSKAWGRRSIRPGWSEDIAFVRTKGAWRIRLFAKRPGAPTS